MERQRIDLRGNTGSTPLHMDKRRLGSFVFSLVLVLGLYAASSVIPPGWYTYLLNLPAIGVIIITAGLRSSDMSTDMTSARWAVRRNGYILTGLYAVTQLFEPFAVYIVRGYLAWPTWQTVSGCWGFAMVWVTAQGLPAWCSYAWKSARDRAHDFWHTP